MKKLTASDLKAGTQIAYVPNHVLREPGEVEALVVKHADVQYGFVTSTSREFAFCRYWNEGRWGLPENQGERGHHLRTTANSEATPYANLILHDSVPQELVDDTLRWIVANQFNQFQPEEEGRPVANVPRVKP